MTAAAGKYLIAKYVPDLWRFEPRNIGVVLWTPVGVRARFLAEDQDHPGEVDERKIPAFVKSAHIYKEWLEFWQRELGKPAIEPATGGFPVPRSSPEFLSALQAANKGNYQLGDGGSLLDDVKAGDLAHLTNVLFVSLVES